MQTLHAAQVVGTLLEFFGCDLEALLAGFEHGQFVAQHLLQQIFQAILELQNPDKVVGADVLLVNAGDIAHIGASRCLKGGPGPVEGGWRPGLSGSLRPGG
ncbi:hypothetical protein [Marinobacterium aestuariivivens]|uniref:Uncharacterized protein n=1 Tax=Marinobacterium aestuariivivens TaxID=1698799 RepID=A0ABW2A690_9GAMM